MCGEGGCFLSGQRIQGLARKEARGASRKSCVADKEGWGRAWRRAVGDSGGGGKKNRCYATI